MSIAAACNSSPESSRKAARELDMPITHQRWEDLGADPGVDAVLIGT